MSDNKEKEPEEKPVVAKTAVDLQRLKLMKLMKNMVSLCGSEGKKKFFFTFAVFFSDYLKK